MTPITKEDFIKKLTTQRSVFLWTTKTADTDVITKQIDARTVYDGDYARVGKEVPEGIRFVLPTGHTSTLKFVDDARNEFYYYSNDYGEFVAIASIYDEDSAFDALTSVYWLVKEA